MKVVSTLMLEFIFSGVVLCISITLFLLSVSNLAKVFNCIFIFLKGGLTPEYYFRVAVFSNGGILVFLVLFWSIQSVETIVNDYFFNKKNIFFKILGK